MGGCSPKALGPEVGRGPCMSHISSSSRSCRCRNKGGVVDELRWLREVGLPIPGVGNKGCGCLGEWAGLSGLWPGCAGTFVYWEEGFEGPCFWWMHWTWGFFPELVLGAMPVYQAEGQDDLRS